MYYNTNQNSNNYYSSYKESMQENHQSNSLKKPVKLGLIILSLGLLSVATVYLANYFSTESKNALFDSQIVNSIEAISSEEKKMLEKIELTGDELPKSIQLQKSTSQDIAQIQLNATDTLQSTEATITNNVSKVTNNINPKDIALIVEIIMAQMNNTSEPTLEEQLRDAEKQTMVKRDLKDMNHYNKVVLNSNKEQTEPSELMQLRNNLNNMLKESITNTNNNSAYSRAIEKEIAVRSNEMKVIIVQKGDTLSKIAEKAYGNKNSYRKIFIANPEVLKNPNKIFIGQRLRIPS